MGRHKRTAGEDTASSEPTPTDELKGADVISSGAEAIAPATQLISAFGVLRQVHGILVELRRRREEVPARG